MLSALELADLRADVLAELPDTCVIRAPVTITDPVRGDLPTWPAVTATVACMVIDGDATEAGYAADEPARRFVVPHDAPVVENTRIEWKGTTSQVMEPTLSGSLALGRVLLAVPVVPGVGP